MDNSCFVEFRNLNTAALNNFPFSLVTLLLFVDVPCMIQFIMIEVKQYINIDGETIK